MMSLQEKLEAAYAQCRKECQGVSKCPKHGLIFACERFFFCPIYDSYRESIKIQKLIDQSIPESLASAELENYIPQNDSQQNLLNVVMRYFSKSAWEKGKGMIISGMPGLGKTHIGAAIYKKLVKSAVSVAFARPKTLGDFKSIETYYKRLEKPKVLVYDDMGTELRKDFIIDMLYVLFDKRLSNHKGVIITTNLSDNQFKQMLGSRLFSRIIEKNFFLEIHGEDYRCAHRSLF